MRLEIYVEFNIENIEAGSNRGTIQIQQEFYEIMPLWFYCLQKNVESF